MAAFDKETEDFIAKYVLELRSKSAAIFAGAGLSRSAGFVDWAGLLKSIAEDVNLDAQRESDLVSVAQYHLNKNMNQRNMLNQVILDELSDLQDKPAINHEIVARLPVHTYWTTNYDRLIEKALENNGRRFEAKYTIPQLARTRRGRDAVVYKMHGDISEPEKVIISRDDYEKYDRSHGPFINALSGDLVDLTFLFLGFSFTDPNLNFILSRIRQNFGNDQRRHYCITKIRTKRDGDDPNYEYEKTRQALFAHDLLRFNIKTIYVNDYADVTSILSAIEKRFIRRTIFISGSAHDYSPWGRHLTEAFLRQLSARLVSLDFRITSGFGLGIGGAVVTGAVEQIYSSSQRSIEDQLVLRPFPIGIEDKEEREKTFKRYRKELVSQAGIALFIMGNKEVDGKIIPADGVRAEFQLACENGAFVIPIGASGHMSDVLWREVMADIDASFPGCGDEIKGLLQRLGPPVSNPLDLIEPLIKLIGLLSKE